MNFSLPKSLEILEKTPKVLNALLNGLSDEWILSNEGGESWNVYEIVGHLIHGEKTDWMIRADIILSESTNKTFEPFDRFAQLKESRGNLQDLLHQFAGLRLKNLDILKSWQLSEEDFDKEGIHPALGQVTLCQLLGAWVVHDLNHLSQISRVMAKQFKTEVGPFSSYLRILQD